MMKIQQVAFICFQQESLRLSVVLTLFDGGEAEPRRYFLKIASSWKGKAFPHIRRQSRTG